MDMRRIAGAASRADAAESGRAGRRLRPMLAGLAMAVVLGTTAAAGQFVGGGHMNGKPTGPADMNVADGLQSYSPMHSTSRQREFILVLTNRDLAQGERGATYEMVRAEPSPEQEKRLEEWREEGIRKAAELTGIPEAVFRWLADLGLPVGEFMRFLAPFLEWLELVEPHNGTTVQPSRKGQAPTPI